MNVRWNDTNKWFEKDTSSGGDGSGPWVELPMDPSQISPPIQGSPTGAVIDFAGSSAPTGWLLCNGSSYSTTTYASLFAVIGYTYGGSGASFNVPDARGRATIGVGQGSGLTNRTLASKVGEENHQLTIAELAAHNHSASSSTSISPNPHGHSVSDPGHSHYAGLGGAGCTSGTGTDYKCDRCTTSGSWFWGPILANTTGISIVTTSLSASTSTSISNTGSNTAHNNMQPSIAFNKIIKI